MFVRIMRVQRDKMEIRTIKYKVRLEMEGGVPKPYVYEYTYE